MEGGSLRMSIEISSDPIPGADGLPVSARGGRPRLATRVTSIAGGDLFGILASVPMTPQFAWADPVGGDRWVGLGEADEVTATDAEAGWAAIETCRSRLAQVAVPAGAGDLLRYFGGIAFDPDSPTHPDWPAGLPARFVLPKVILHQREGKETVTAAITLPHGSERSGRKNNREIERLIEQIGAGSPVAGVGHPLRLRPIEVDGHRERWMASVRHALDRIEAGRIRKIVLSRDRILAAEEPIDPAVLFATIAQSRPHGLQFLIRFDRESAFLGATPERLISHHGLSIRCDCLAGTAPRGATSIEDRCLAAALLASEKDRREHRFVLDGIVTALQPFARWLEHPTAPSILPLPKLQHLSSPIHGALRDGVRFGDLIRRLHPTPAVGGEPRAEAFEMICEIEARPRGWYAGLIGWIGEASADLAVGIRSAMVRGRRATLIGGAGIVLGSDPAAEWDETTRKCDSFLSLFAEEED